MHSIELRKAKHSDTMHFRAFYPEVRLSTSSYAQIDSRLAFGHVSSPGQYTATITRPDLFDHYLEEQIQAADPQPWRSGDGTGIDDADPHPLRLP